MAITDVKQRVMPMPEDLLPDRGKQLIVPESVLLVNPINPDLKGEVCTYMKSLNSNNKMMYTNLQNRQMQVDDKYMYSMDNKDSGLHGWISSVPIIGFWTIFPSQEFRNGGPTKQNLTVHTGPTCLAVKAISLKLCTLIQMTLESVKIYVYVCGATDVSRNTLYWVRYGSSFRRGRDVEEGVWTRICIP